MAGGKNMANETATDGKITFHGNIDAIATFVSMCNSFLASHQEAKDKGVRYYTNLFTDDNNKEFLVDESKIAQYLEKSKTFALEGCGRNDYINNIEYQLEWLLSGLKRYYSENQVALEAEVAKLQAAIQSGLKIEYEFLDDDFNNWDEREGTVDLAGLTFSLEKASLVDTDGLEVTDSSY